MPAATAKKKSAPSKQVPTVTPTPANPGLHNSHYTAEQLRWQHGQGLIQLAQAKQSRAHVLGCIKRPAPLRDRGRRRKLPTALTTHLHSPPRSRDDGNPTAPLKCPQCLIYDLKSDGHQLRCTYCGMTRWREHISLVAMTYGEVTAFNQGDYFRLTHLRDIMRQRVPSVIQSKNQDISLETLYRLCLLLYNEPQFQLRSSCDISLQYVKAAGKQLGIKNKNTIIYLTELLSGVARPAYSIYDMNIFTCVFQAFQQTYERYKDVRRTNFLRMYFNYF